MSSPVVTLALIDRFQHGNVPDEFYESLSEDGLNPALATLGDLCFPPRGCVREDDTRSFVRDMAERLKLVTSDSLRVVPLYLGDDLYVSADSKAEECATLVEALSNLHKMAGGNGLKVLTLEATTPERTVQMLGNARLREFVE